MDTGVEAALAQLRQKLADLDKERKKVLIAISVLGGEPIGEDAVVAEEEEEGPGEPILSSGPRRRLIIKPDTYYRMSQHQAARTYLRDLGHADRIENILKAIRDGGADVGGERPLETLRATLAQNSKVFEKVAPSTFGLREFYEGRPAKKMEKPTPKKKTVIRARKPEARKAQGQHQGGESGTS